MARSIWNGTITFGLIAVPIKVHSATEDKTIHFHQVHAEDGARIKQKRLCSKEGEEVPYKEVAKGYEISDGEYVMLSKEEIDAAAGERSRQIALDEFVCAEEIDPVFYDHTYYLGAGKDGEDAYRLLHEALGRSSRAGIGRWVFHNREYMVAVRPLDGALALHTMRYADELVESLHKKFKADAFEDRYRDAVLELIKRKAKGEEISLERPEEPEQTDDLMAALEASLSGSGGNGRRKNGGGKGGRKKSKGKS